MKKILSIALCAAAVSAFAVPAEVELGAVGVTAITSSLSNTIVAISYNDLAGGSGMVYSNLVKTTNLTVGDRLVEFRDDKYTGWVLALAESGNVKYWKETNEIFVDGSGHQINLISSTADTVRGAVGTGIWLMRQNPKDTSGNPLPFYIYGKPVSSKITTTQAGKWNLLGNPNETGSFSGFTPVVGDQIAIPVDNGFRTYRCRVKDGKTQWFYETYSTSEDGKTATATATATKVYGPPSVDAAKGLWYYTRDSQTINWN